MKNIKKILCFLLLLLMIPLTGCDPTGQFKLTIIDEHGYIYDKPEQQYFTPFTEIKLHSYPIMDADLVMYVDGEFYSKQKDIETDDGYIWEYTFTMPIDEATLEFKVEGGM